MSAPLYPHVLAVVFDVRLADGREGLEQAREDRDDPSDVEELRHVEEDFQRGEQREHVRHLT